MSELVGLTKRERNLVQFKRSMEAMIGTNNRAYKKYPINSDPVYTFYTLENIRQLLAQGNPEALRELSRFFYRYSGIYHRVLIYYASLLLYDYVVTPKMTKAVDKNKMLTRYNNALEFLDKLRVAENFKSITEKILKQGVYYGFLRIFPDGVVFQELPIEWCRSRYKNDCNVNILEFNVRYFDTITMGTEREEVLASFPRQVVQYYNNRDSMEDTWMRVPDTLGVVFYFEDFIPFFVSAIPEIYRLEQAQDREADRDAEELQKLLIVRMPISNKTDELIFSDDEVEIMHAGMVNMLKNNDYINVLTTYGDASLEQAQNTSSQAQRNSLEKFTDTVYDYLGVSKLLFNAEGNTALKYSVDKDTALMFRFADQFATWLTFIVNHYYSNPSVSFDVEFLPTTIHNRKELMDTYLKGAQYGYSKIYVGVSQGIKQSNLTNLVKFENEILGLADQMIPLQSSHTATNSQNSDGKSKTSGKSGDNNNEPGRPELDDSDKSDKTLANRDSM